MYISEALNQCNCVVIVCSPFSTVIFILLLIYNNGQKGKNERGFMNLS